MSRNCLPQPPLADLLSVVLPPPEDAILLRACLQRGDSGREACQIWLRQYEEAEAEIYSEFTKSLLPLLYNAVRTHDIQLDGRLLTVLRTAALREELRTKAYRSICRSTLAALTDSNMPAIVLEGAALADTIYADPALRHNHNIELLVEQRHLDRTIDLLMALGFAPRKMNAEPDLRDIEFSHASGLPLVLRRQLFQVPFFNLPFIDLWSRGQTSLVSDVPVRVLSPEDTLLHLCGETSYLASRDSFHWVNDAWFLIDRHPDLDWEFLIDRARQCHLALPLSVTLRYLAANFDAPVPTTFLCRLSKAASKATAIGRDLALFSARLSIPGTCRSVIRETRNWRGRAAIIRSLLLPSPKYLLWRHKIHTAWFLPWYYVSRPIRYGTPRIFRIIKRVMRRAGTKLVEGLSRITC